MHLNTPIQNWRKVSLFPGSFPTFRLHNVLPVFIICGWERREEPGTVREPFVHTFVRFHSLRFSTSRQTLTWIPDSFFSRYSLLRQTQAAHTSTWFDIMTACKHRYMRRFSSFRICKVALFVKELRCWCIHYSARHLCAALVTVNDVIKMT